MIRDSLRCRLAAIGLLLAAFAVLPATASATTWTTPSQLVGGTDMYASPEIAVNSAGDGALIWNDTQAPGVDSVHIVQMYGGGQWTDHVAPPGAEEVEDPVVDINEAGTVVVAWREDDSDIQVLTRIKGGSWVGPIKVFDGSAGDALDVAIDGANRLAIVYINSSLDRLELAYRGTNDSWSTGVALSGGSTSPARPDVDVNESGRVAITWESTGDTIRGTVFEADFAQVLAGGTALRSGDVSVLTPRVAIAGTGAATVVWQQESALGTAVMGSDFDGASFSAPYTVHDRTAYVYSLDLVGNAAGSQVATWSAGNLDNVDYLVARRPAGGGFAAAEKWGEDNDFGPFGALSWNLTSDAAISSGGATALISANDPRATLGAITSPFPGALDIDATPTDAYGHGGAYETVIGIDGQGNAYAAWRDYDQTPWVARTTTPAGGGGTPGSKPSLSIRAPKPLPRLRKALRSGVLLPVTCTPSCTVSGSVSGPGIRKAASGSRKLNGSGKLKLSFSKAARKRYARSRKVKFTFTVTAKNSAGSTTRRLVVTLRR